MRQSNTQIQVVWHAERADSVLAAWNTNEHGLSSSEVTRRQQQYGLNVLPEKGPTPLWKIVLRQFISPLIYILVAAAVVSAAIGDLKDASFIAVVLLLNTVIGAYQEWQAEQSCHASDDKADELMRDAVNDCRAHGCNVCCQSNPGDPKSLLLASANLWQADMIVMGNSARSVLLKKVLGDTLLETLRYTKIPLFLAQ